MTLYKIHYTQNSQAHTAEIEANSPTEAVVKFQHLRGCFTGAPGRRPEVTSVQPVELPVAWSG